MFVMMENRNRNSFTCGVQEQVEHMHELRQQPSKASRSNSTANSRTKPAMEIYRPPNKGQRMDMVPLQGQQQKTISRHQQHQQHQQHQEYRQTSPVKMYKGNGSGYFIQRAKILYEHQHPMDQNDYNRQLNVYAKEFTSMRHGGSGQCGEERGNPLQQSKSSGNIAHMMYSQQVVPVRHDLIPLMGVVDPAFQHQSHQHPIRLQQSKSSGNILHHLQSIANQQLQNSRVHFNFEDSAKNDGGNLVSSSATHRQEEVLMRQRPSSFYSGTRQAVNVPKIFKQYVSTGLSESDETDSDIHKEELTLPAGYNLKRSKSMGATVEMMENNHSAMQQQRELMDIDEATKRDSYRPIADILDHFPSSIRKSVVKMLDNLTNISGRDTMDLVLQLFDFLTESSRNADPVARLCISIIENEPQETFLESLLNTCQEWFYDRERLLCPPHSEYNNNDSSSSCSKPNQKWVAFVAFLNEMYCQLKRSQLYLRTQWEGQSPGHLLLTLICECCIVCLRPPFRNNLSEIESMFFAVTSVGRDLEQECPGRLVQLLAVARDAFIHPDSTAYMRRTVMQLLELHAAKWQLPAPALLYYYPAAGNIRTAH